MASKKETVIRWAMLDANDVIAQLVVAKLDAEMQAMGKGERITDHEYFYDPAKRKFVVRLFVERDAKPQLVASP